MESSEIAKILRNGKNKPEGVSDASGGKQRAAMLALILANRALDYFYDENGMPDFQKAIPVIPHLT